MNNIDNLDLDINNYSLEEILELMKLPINFTHEQLKDAKKTVLMTHPDKSGKPSEVFLFFSAAYKLLFQIYLFRTKSNNTCKSTEYDVSDINYENLLTPNVIDKFKKSKDFNVRFNEIWEKHKLDAFGDQEGYGDWLKDNINDEDIQPASMDDVNRKIIERKKQVRSLIVKQEITSSSSLGAYGHSNLTHENPGCFEAPIFGGLQYDDVRRAYTESVVPVTDEDYQVHQNFSNLDELQSFRQKDLDDKFLYSNHEEKLEKMKYNDDAESAHRAYNLAKEDEKLRTTNAQYSASWLRLK